MSTTGVRQRKTGVLGIVQELDAFPKVPEDYKHTTASGGGVSILVFLCIGFLVMSEVMYYTAVELNFEYEVDKMHEQKLKINIDMTVAMKCEWIGADILDLTGQRTQMFGKLNEEAVVFELSPDQQRHFDMIRSMNDYIREEYHSIHKLLWRTGYMGKNNEIPKRDSYEGLAYDGCRLHGSLTVNKVAGNFHITAGKSVPVFPKGHAHLAMMVKDKDYNFTHRIDHLSFGEETPGIIAPLDSELKVANANYHTFQYFMQVVPTRVQTRFSSLDTYQYAYTEHDRPINHAAGSHGIPGIFFKYDISSLKVTVKEEHKPYWQFLVRLCGIVGGVFATSGILHHLVGFAADCICCRFLKSSSQAALSKEGSISNLHEAMKTMDSQPTPPLMPSPPANDLIAGANTLHGNPNNGGSTLRNNTLLDVAS